MQEIEYSSMVDEVDWGWKGGAGYVDDGVGCFRKERGVEEEKRKKYMRPRKSSKGTASSVNSLSGASYLLRARNNILKSRRTGTIISSYLLGFINRP